MTKVLYIGTMAVSTIILGVVRAVLVRRPEMTDGHYEADPLVAAANALALVLALVISLLLPAVSYFPLLLLLAADPAARAWRRLRRL
jgi:hypothetical protein